MEQETKNPDQGHYKKLYEDLKKNVEIAFSVVKDLLSDSRRHDGFKNLVIVMMFIIIMLLSTAMFAQNIYYQEKMASLIDGFTIRLMDFVNDLDVYSEVEMSNDQSNNNALSIERS